MLCDCESGKTLARDGASEIHDFNELGNEWQVLPAEDMLFLDKVGNAAFCPRILKANVEGD